VAGSVGEWQTSLTKQPANRKATSTKMPADHLDELDPFELLDTEAARLDGWFGSLDERAWQKPSRCAGWSVRDVLAHLAGEELYNHACLNDDIDGFFNLLEQAGVGKLGDFGDFNEWCIQMRKDRPAGDVLAEWRASSQQTRARMRERGRGGQIQTSIGPYPVGKQALHYASEFATHGDDVSAPVDQDEEPARTNWRARFACLVLREQGSPLSVRYDRGCYVVCLGIATAELTPPDFVAATVERLSPDHPLEQPTRDALGCLA
jgi:uncharacterized protein (TIGR03083 family)